MKINWNNSKSGEYKKSKRLEYKTVKILVFGAFLLFFYSFVSAQDEKKKRDSLKIDGCTVIFDPPSLERFIGTLEKRLNEIKSKEKDLLLREAYLKRLEDEISAKLAELIKLKKDVQALENLCFEKVKQKEEEKVKALQDQKLLFEADQRKTIISYEKRISDVMMEYEKKIKEIEAKHRREIQEYEKKLTYADKSIAQLTDDFKKKMEDLAKNFDKERKKLQDEIEKLKSDYEKKLEVEVKKIKDDCDKKISQLSSITNTLT
jgi:predicted  nucleic acid-binding Zn-ribbon protein